MYIMSDEFWKILLSCVYKIEMSEETARIWQTRIEDPTEAELMHASWFPWQQGSFPMLVIL